MANDLEFYEVKGHAAWIKVFCGDKFCLFLPDAGGHPRREKPLGTLQSLLRVENDVLLQCNPNDELLRRENFTVPADTVLWTGFDLEQQGKTLFELLAEGQIYHMEGNLIVQD